MENFQDAGFEQLAAAMRLFPHLVQFSLDDAKCLSVSGLHIAQDLEFEQFEDVLTRFCSQSAVFTDEGNQAHWVTGRHTYVAGSLDLSICSQRTICALADFRPAS